MIDIYKFRKDKGWSQLELAQMLQVSRSLIASIENGKRKISPYLSEKINTLILSESVELEEKRKEEDIYREKYFQLLAEYKILSDKLTKCMEEKQVLYEENKSKIIVPDKPI